jgi:hypothetical protein
MLIATFDRMLCKFSSKIHRDLIMIWLFVMWVPSVSVPGICFGQLSEPQSRECATNRLYWKVISTENESIRLKLSHACIDHPPNRVYVITHGMNGTSAGDRFEQFAAKLNQGDENCQIVLVDWSGLSTAECWGVSNPWRVASRIPDVAAECHRVLESFGIPADRYVFIGESFGNNVNAKISELFGNQSILIALNPASELGGGGRMELGTCSKASYALHTLSIFDSLTSTAQHDALLTVPPNCTEEEKHTYGIQWLTRVLDSTASDPLQILRHLPESDQHAFSVRVDDQGRLHHEIHARCRAVPADDAVSPSLEIAKTSNNFTSAVTSR